MLKTAPKPLADLSAKMAALKQKNPVVKSPPTVPKVTKGLSGASAGEKGTGLEARITIAAPNFQRAKITIRGTAPYVQHAFSQKALQTMMDTQEAGSTTRKGTLRKPKNFDEVYKGATHYSRDGWIGIPAAAFRLAMISACRTVGFKMTLAKLSLFVVADGFDKSSGEPLVKITKGTPQKHFASARNANGSTDVRCRPMWGDGWEAVVTLKWDADQFTASDVSNLLDRVGQQVGVGEGRADSRNSAGCGWGHFEVVR